MTSNPLISIIVPVYNSEEFLEECLNSLRLQTYENLEFICVDDGSCDNSLNILCKFQEIDDRFIIVNNENKEGASAARNAGLKQAKGDFISFVNSYDRVSLSLYKKFVNLKEKPDIYIFNAVSLDKQADGIFPVYFFNVNEWKDYRDENKIHSFDDCINPFHGKMAVYNKIYRADFLKTLGDELFPSGSIFGDRYFFFLTMLEAKSIKINSEPVYYYRNNSDNQSNRVFDIFTIIDKIEELLKSKNLYENYKYALFQYKYKQYAYNFFKADEEMRDDFYVEMQNRLRRYENENLKQSMCERLQLFGMFKNILNLNSGEFYQKYNGKI